METPASTADIGQIVDQVIKRNGCVEHPESRLIAVLQGVQGEYGYLPREALEEVAERMGLPLSRVYGVATFFHQFRLRPKGKHTITVCSGTACHVQGSGDLANTLRENLKLRPGEDTSDDGEFTLVQVRCLGACGLAPIMKVDEEFYGNMNSAGLAKVLGKYRRAKL